MIHSSVQTCIVTKCETEYNMKYKTVTLKSIRFIMPQKCIDLGSTCVKKKILNLIQKKVK